MTEQRPVLEGDPMDIGDAIAAMRGGLKVARRGWNGKGMFLFWVQGGWTHDGHQHSPGSAYLPFIAMRTVQGDVVPWVASQTCLLGNDWYVVTRE